jgi:hypothetical protein
MIHAVTRIVIRLGMLLAVGHPGFAEPVGNWLSCVDSVAIVRYPELARRVSLGGAFDVRLAIGQSGKIESALITGVLKQDDVLLPLFDRSIRSSIAMWKLSTGCHGQEVTVRFEFVGRDHGFHRTPASDCQGNGCDAIVKVGRTGISILAERDELQPMAN